MVGLFLLLTITLVFVAAEVDRLLHDNYLNELSTESTIELIEVREEIEESIFGHFLLLQKITTFIEENPSLTQKQFASYLQSLEYDQGKIINVAAAPDLKVEMVFPVEGNERALGLNYRDNPEQLPGVLRAAESGTATITGPVSLVQGGRAFVFRQPAYVPGTSPENGKRLWGIVSMVADYDRFLVATGLSELSRGFDVLVKSASDEAPRHGTVYGQPAVEGMEPVSLELDFPNGHWEIMAVPAGGWPAASPTYIKDRLLIALVSILIIAVVLIIVALAVLQRRAQMRLVSAIDAMDDGFAMFDADGRLVAFNAKYAEIYQVSSRRITHGARFEDIIRLGVEGGQHPDAIGCEEEWIQKRVEGFFGPDTEFEQELSNGRYLLASDRALSDGGRVSVRTDATQLKKALDEAESASRAKSEFIDTLSHELRTPITVILGLSSLGKNIETLGMTRSLREKLDGSEVDIAEVRHEVSTLINHFVETMEKQERSAKHLHGLVEDMIDFAKTETRKVKVHPEVLEIDSLVSSAAEQSRLRAEENGLGFKVTARGGQVYCDPLRTTQILLNLVGNAIKFTERGTVEIKAYQSGDEAVFEVIDTGPGIPPEEQGRIFEAFEQLESSSTRKHAGLGLGLAISRSLATIQNGALEIESDIGKGAKFTLRLPASEDTASRAAPATHRDRLEAAE